MHDGKHRCLDGTQSFSNDLLFNTCSLYPTNPLLAFEFLFAKRDSVSPLGGKWTEGQLER